MPKDHARKFTDDQVRTIRSDIADGMWRSQLDAANHYDVSQSRISDIVTRKTYREVE